jgi:hypothetical protein
MRGCLSFATAAVSETGVENRRGLCDYLFA